MLKQILCAASLAFFATPALADPDKNESGKRYDERRDRYGDRDRYYDKDSYYGDVRRDHDRGDRFRNRRLSRAIPAGHLPPPGSCRVWFYDRPAGHQLPPTDCQSARYQA